MPVRLLLTSVGRRGYLVEWFRDALDGEGQVHACNSIDTLALRSAHVALVAPPIHDPAYVPTLVDHCARHAITAIVPLLDVDLPVLARARDELAAVGTRVLVADPDAVDACNDKRRTAALLAELGIGTPATWYGTQEALDAVATGASEFPLVVKPRFGMGSVGVAVAEDAGELGLLVHRSARAARRTVLAGPADAAGPTVADDDLVLVQAHAPGREHGIDVVTDLDGRLVAVWAKRKLAMRAGETDIGETVDPAPFLPLASALAAALRPPGILSVDAFLDGDEVWVTDLNARISGHYPISHLAGADLPRQLVRWIAGGATDPELLSCHVGVRVAKDLVPRRVPPDAVAAGGSG